MLPILRNNSALAPTAGGPSHRLDSLFDRVFGEDPFFGHQSWGDVPLAMWEDDDHWYVEAELPGMTDRDMNVTVHNGMLLIRGERKPEDGRRYLYNSRSYGQFERVVTLPAPINADEVRAGFENGILCITLPKSPEARPKRVAIQTS